MTENKTKPTDLSVEVFLDRIMDPVRKAGCKTISTVNGRTDRIRTKNVGESLRTWASTSMVRVAFISSIWRILI